MRTSQLDETPGADSAVAQLLEDVQQLEQRVDTLEHTIEQKDDRIDELESQIEIRGEDNAMENLWIRNLPVGKMLRNRKQVVKQLEGRITNIERGEVDPGEIVANAGTDVDPSDLLPLHNAYLSVQNLHPSEHNLSENQEIAARLFPYLGQYAHSNSRKLVLPSTKIKDILEREIATPKLSRRLDVKNPNTNTIRRVMKFVGEFGSEIMEFDDSAKTNRLLIDRGAWVEYTQEVTEGIESTDYGTVNTENETVSARKKRDEAEDRAAQEPDKQSSPSDYGVVITDQETTVISN
ncbi:hypothetical protein [Natronococcus sp. A-GB7]|uniref:hypothetical protein n=1 Tax=Natronococcus sp. A-GB7 TaxID=3037649 RepID=UPI00241D9F78|nr:hypothetical protein [Natronococcus sp. A-GB7]MDG5821666.1 hypothetical protein [Natronococcus sp. A-GB7]